MSKNQIYAIAAIVLIAFLGFVAYGEEIGDLLNPPDDKKKEQVEGVEYTIFKYTGVARDSGTSVTGATTRGWYDWDHDGFMDPDEIFTLTESSGIYSSDIELPISAKDEDGNMVWEDIWIQGRATNYLVVHDLIHITGTRNSDGSAKPVGQIEYTYLDDAITYSGLIGSTAFDDSDDYNATTLGTVGTDVDCEVTVTSGGTASRGVTSQVWDQVDYETIYGYNADVPYYIRWDDYEDFDGDLEDIAYVGTHLSTYLTLQDYDDSGISGSDWDDKMADQTNVYLNQFELDWNELFYKDSDSSAFTWDGFEFTLEIDAAFALAYIGLLIDIKMSDYIDQDASYTTAANAVGTLGADWDGLI